MRSEDGRTSILFLAAGGVALVALGLVAVLTRPSALAQPTLAPSATSEGVTEVEAADTVRLIKFRTRAQSLWLAGAPSFRQRRLPTGRPRSMRPSGTEPPSFGR